MSFQSSLSLFAGVWGRAPYNFNFNYMKKINWSVADYDYTKTYPDIDYSEVITEPGLVLSMRQIYERYAAMGVDLLHSGEYVEDEEDPDRTEIEEFDDPLDMLQRSSAIQARETPPRKKSKPDGKQPDGKQRKSDLSVSSTDAPAPPAPAAEPGASTERQNETK